MASIETLVGKAKKDKNGQWIWNGESYEEVLLMIPYLKSMNFTSTADAQEFENMEKEWKAAQIKSKAQKSGDKKTVAQVNRWQKQSKIKHDDMSDHFVYIYNNPTFGFVDSLSHAKKGEEIPGHKYISREWKNNSWVYNYGNKGPVNQSNNTYAVNDKQKHNKEKADFNNKDWHISAQYNFSKDNANDAKKQADEYTKLFREEVALRDPAKLKEGWTDDEKERADYCRTHNVTGRMKMYRSIADAYNSIKDVGDVYIEKFVNPYKEAKEEMEKYIHSTNPNDRIRYYKAAKEYTERYQDLKIAMDEYSNYIDKTLSDINDIEELIKNGEDFHGNTHSYSTYNKYVQVNANIDDNLNIFKKNGFNKKYDTYF